MRRLTLVVLMAPMIALAADYRITVNGTIHSSPSAPVALYVGPSTAGCSGEPNAVTDERGGFSFVRTIERSWRENFAVVVRTFSLCVRQAENWIQLWSYRTGPPPARITFDCAVTKQPCQVEWDGRRLQSIQPNSALLTDAKLPAI